jgi:hypothetical protein
VDCWRCIELGDSYPAEAVAESGLCGHCHYRVMTEEEEKICDAVETEGPLGVEFLETLLESHAKYSAWCSLNDRDPY